MPATASAPHELALPTLKRHSLSRSHRPEERPAANGHMITRDATSRQLQWAPDGVPVHYERHCPASTD